jgi:hypothetical protein
MPKKEKSMDKRIKGITNLNELGHLERVGLLIKLKQPTNSTNVRKYATETREANTPIAEIDRDIANLQDVGTKVDIHDVKFTICCSIL